MKHDVQPGTWWRHINSGTAYRVLHIANDQATDDKKSKFPLTVVYAHISKGAVWTRLYDDFIEKFEYMGVEL